LKIIQPLCFFKKLTYFRFMRALSAWYFSLLVLLP